MKEETPETRQLEVIEMSDQILHNIENNSTKWYQYSTTMRIIQSVNTEQRFKQFHQIIIPKDKNLKIELRHIIHFFMRSGKRYSSIPYTKEKCHLLHGSKELGQGIRRVQFESFDRTIKKKSNTRNLMCLFKYHLSLS